jgi:hypothetical protein
MQILKNLDANVIGLDTILRQRIFLAARERSEDVRFLAFCHGIDAKFRGTHR